MNNTITNTPTVILTKPIEIHIIKDNYRFNVKLISVDNEVTLQIFREFDHVYLEKSFNFDSLFKENNNWFILENTQNVIDNIIDEIQNSVFEINENSITFV